MDSNGITLGRLHIRGFIKAQLRGRIRTMQGGGLVFVISAHQLINIMLESLSGIGRLIAIFLEDGRGHPEHLMLLHGALVVDVFSVA